MNHNETMVYRHESSDQRAKAKTNKGDTIANGEKTGEGNDLVHSRQWGNGARDHASLTRPHRGEKSVRNKVATHPGKGTNSNF